MPYTSRTGLHPALPSPRPLRRSAHSPPSVEVDHPSFDLKVWAVRGILQRKGITSAEVLDYMTMLEEISR